jgi:hypothetical protein
MEYNEKLSKSELGIWIAGKDDDDVQLLKAFTDSMDFRGEEFVVSIRKYLALFRLPGESQKIHRIIQQFAEKYHSDNPTVLPTRDSAFLLAYSVIILNTSQHNPAIADRDKMTKDDFYHGLNDDENITKAGRLPRELLDNIYDSIALNELKVNGDPDKKGWNKAINALPYKAGRLWFCLIGNELLWYKTPAQVKLVGKILLEYVRIREEGETFSITSCLPQKIRFVVFSKGKQITIKTLKFEIVCENEQIKDSWATVVRNNVTFQVLPQVKGNVKKVKFKQRKTKKF